MTDEQGPFEAFGLPLPPELGELLKRQHDRAHIAADANQARIDRFLTALDVDGLMAMRTILCMGDMAKSLSANFWDGQVVSLLRYVHKVDPDTGKDPLATEHLDTEGQ
jgi:hypothetical protein